MGCRQGGGMTAAVYIAVWVLTACLIGLAADWWERR